MNISNNSKYQSFTSSVGQIKHDAKNLKAAYEKVFGEGGEVSDFITASHTFVDTWGASPDSLENEYNQLETDIGTLGTDYQTLKNDISTFKTDYPGLIKYCKANASADTKTAYNDIKGQLSNMTQAVQCIDDGIDILADFDKAYGQYYDYYNKTGGVTSQDIEATLAAITQPLNDFVSKCQAIVTANPTAPWASQAQTEINTITSAWADAQNQPINSVQWNEDMAAVGSSCMQLMTTVMDSYMEPMATTIGQDSQTLKNDGKALSVQYAVGVVSTMVNPTSYLGQMAAHFIEPLINIKGQFDTSVKKMLGIVATMEACNVIINTITNSIEAGLESNVGGNKEMPITITDAQNAQLEKAFAVLNKAGISGSDPFTGEPPTCKAGDAYDVLKSVTGDQSQQAHKMSTSMLEVTTSYQALQNTYKTLTNLMAKLYQTANSALSNI